MGTQRCDSLWFEDVCVDLSDGTLVAPPAEPVKLNTRTFLLDKAKVKDEKSAQADEGADTCIINE